MIFECELDISLKVASARFTFSLKVNVPNMLMNLTCTQTSNNFLMKLIKVIVKYCIYNSFCSLCQTKKRSVKYDC